MPAPTIHFGPDTPFSAREQEALSKKLAAGVVLPLAKLHGELDAGRRELMAEGSMHVRRLHDQHTALRSLRDQQLQAVSFPFLPSRCSSFSQKFYMMTNLMRVDRPLLSSFSCAEGMLILY